ncbi:hypothetical protein ACHAW5_002945 [Stephanodiscus triporus]|uniref:Tetratricopeptide repeat protein n=1 Tax=Stephanodiscus triporus TaxID=2934178 RepID=A0ABD3NU04_9STRA
MKVSAIVLSAATKIGAGSAAFEQELEERDRSDDYNVLIWERETLTHFRRSAWGEVITACRKVLDVPGQSETNYHVLFRMGYASMRLGDYESAADYFVRANRIDGRWIALRLAMQELRMIWPLRRGRRKTTLIVRPNDPSVGPRPR